MISRDSVATFALAVAQLVSWGSVYYAFSLFVVPLEQTMGWSRISTNAALSCGLLVSGLAAYPVGKWIDHGYGRRVMVAGSVLSAAMLLLWSQAHSIAVLYVVWIGLGVAMAATLYDPVFSIITMDFPASFRSKITQVTLVAGFASTVFIPLTQGLVTWLGWREALVVLAILNLALCVPLQWVAIRRSATHQTNTGQRTAMKAINAAATRRALRTPTFWGLAVCFTAYYATFAALTFHLVPLMTERKVPSAVILFTMGIIGPAQVLARILWATVGRAVRPSRVGLIVTTAFPLSVVILMACGTSTFGLAAFATVYGGANGMMTILRGTIVQDVMWTEGYGATSGLLSVPSNIAKGMAPLSAAAIWAFHDSYMPVEWAVLVVSLLSAIAFMAAMRLAPSHAHLNERSGDMAALAAAESAAEPKVPNLNLQISGAQVRELVQIKALLTASGLPATDITETHLDRFLVVHNPGGAVVASVGLERFADGAMLRSLAVAKEYQNLGLGRLLVLRAEQMAMDEGCAQLWLLTTTADGFFRKRGYIVIDRHAVPEDVRQNAEFSLLCPASAMCLHKQLGER